MRRAVPPLHVVTDDEVLARASFAGEARAVLAAGGEGLALHLRGPRTPGCVLYELAAALVPAARAAGAALLVNDRVDVALACGADGAHLGARGMAPGDARALLGESRLLGVSVHSPREADGLRPGDVDILFVGTLYATPSHPERGGSGPGLLREFSGAGVPRVGIGGITPGRVGEVRGSGAQGVAVVRGVWDAPDAVSAVAQYLEAWREQDV